MLPPPAGADDDERAGGGEARHAAEVPFCAATPRGVRPARSALWTSPPRAMSKSRDA